MHLADSISHQGVSRSLSGYERTSDQPLKFRKGEQIFAQGDAAISVFFVQKGRVKLSVNSKQGKEAIIGILGEGHFFGEACLQGRRVQSATAEALGNCTIHRIDRSALLDTDDMSPIREVFFNYLLHRVSRVQDDLADQLLYPSEVRLARLLLILANYDGNRGAPIVPIELSQETLAAMIGTTRSRVCFFMSKFRRLGFISQTGKITVHESLKNFMSRG